MSEEDTLWTTVGTSILEEGILRTNSGMPLPQEDTLWKVVVTSIPE